MNMIEIKNVVKEYNQRRILDINYFAFEKGKTYLIVGENGSGKTTLLKLILQLIKPNTGEIILNTKRIGFVPERIKFPEFVKVSHFLRAILEIRRYTDLEIKLKIKDMLEKWELEDKYIYSLSKGMRQKLAIIQAIIHAPNLYIFDEPLNGLDKKSQQKFMEYLRYLKMHKQTIIVTTHYYQLYRESLDYIIEIDEGKLNAKTS